MNTYNEEQASSHEKLVVHINDDDYQQLPSSGSFRRQQHRHSEMLGKTVKTMFALISLFILAILCTYIGSKTIFDSSSNGNSANKYNDGRKNLEPLPQNAVKDCRTSGCYNSFECVEIKVDQVCFVQPCPSIVYECLPPAMLNDPADAMFSIQQVSLVGDGELGNDDSDSTGELTQGYFNCLKQHGGKSIWNHPDQPCNTCRCTATGSIACTKMLCIPDKQDTSVHDDIVPDILTTIMSPVPAPADADPENTSQFFTSIVIDVKA